MSLRQYQQKKPEVKKEKKYKVKEEVDVLDKLIEEDEKHQKEEKRKTLEIWNNINAQLLVVWNIFLIFF